MKHIMGCVNMALAGLGIMLLIIYSAITFTLVGAAIAWPVWFFVYLLFSR